MAAGDQTNVRVSMSSSGAVSPTSDSALLPEGSTKDAAVIIDDVASTDEELEQQTGWHSQRCTLSLPEAHATISMPARAKASPWRMMLAFAGCGTIISVGYM
jgi:hypothetical protein